MSEQCPAKTPSTVRHTRAIQRDRRVRPAAAPPAPRVEARLAELIHPATLTLPVLVACVLSLLWRCRGGRCPSGCAASRRPWSSGC